VLAGTVDLADETCDGAGRRERDGQMDVIGGATERQKPASIARWRRGSTAGLISGMRSHVDHTRWMTSCAS
jgi:hypothetical protein